MSATDFHFEGQRQMSVLGRDANLSCGEAEAEEGEGEVQKRSGAHHETLWLVVHRRHLFLKVVVRVFVLRHCRDAVGRCSVRENEVSEEEEEKRAKRKASPDDDRPRGR